MKKVTRLKQPEGGVDIFKKKPIPKKPRQPEGSGVTKKKKLVQRQPEGSGAPKKKKLIQRQPEGSGVTKKKLVQRQPEGSGAPKKKKLIQRQPEGSGAPKKITGRFEFADTNRAKKTKVALPKSKPSSIKKTKVALPKSKPSSIKKTVKTPPTSVDSALFKPKQKRARGPKVSVPGSMRGGPPQRVGTAKKKQPSFFEKIISETKRNFSGDFKKGTGRFKSLSTGKTNFNKKKKKLPKQIRV